MLDENFAEQMKQIVKMCSRTRQTLLFSATMTEAVNDLISVCLKKPVRIFVDSNQDVAFNLRQEFVRYIYKILRKEYLNVVKRKKNSCLILFLKVKQSSKNRKC